MNTDGVQLGVEAMAALLRAARAEARERMAAEGFSQAEIEQVMQFAEAMHAEQLAKVEGLLEVTIGGATLQ